MTIETHVDRAGDRVGAELTTTEAKRAALATFGERVADLPAETTASRAGVGGGGTATLVDAEPATEGGCRAVRRAFADTVQPHVEDGEASLLAAVRSELSDSVAVALAPSTGASLTPDLQRSILAAVEARRAECEVLHRAMERETESLTAAAEVVDETVDWLREADETPLSDLDFDALAERHERLAAFREQCATALEDRQRLLRETTSHDGQAGIRHRTLVASLYEDFPVDYPVLSTLTRLESTCGDCQRAVRDHLVRRV